MDMTRRNFVKHAALAPAVMPALAHAQDAQREQTAEPAAAPLRIGMTDWNLGRRGGCFGDNRRRHGRGGSRRGDWFHFRVGCGVFGAPFVNVKDAEPCDLRRAKGQHHQERNPENLIRRRCG